jgi:hypothetical protein
MPNVRQRGGMTISAKGGERGLGWWQDKFQTYDATSFVQRAGRELDAIHKMAMRLHNQNRAVIEKTPNVILPELPVRLTLARAEQKKLAATKEKLAAIQIEMEQWAQRAFRPFDYSKATKPSESFAARVELRQVFSRLNETQRREAIKRDEFRAAVLEQPPEASGMAEADWNILRLLELERKFPQELQTRADATEALATVYEAAQTLDIALSNELQSIGAPVSEPTETPPQETWA